MEREPEVIEAKAEEVIGEQFAYMPITRYKGSKKWWYGTAYSDLESAHRHVYGDSVEESKLIKIHLPD